MNRIKQAEYLARFVHEGKTRTNGTDSVEHPKRVAQAGIDKGEPENNICARWMHDNIEDAKHPKIMSDLIRAWFYEPDAENEDCVWELVTLLTRTKYVSYNMYILEIADSNNPDAITIKLDDIIDNTGETPTERQCRKYREACLIFESKGVKIPQILVERLLND